MSSQQKDFFKEQGALKALPNGYAPILEEIRKKVRESRTRAIRGVNIELIKLYRSIGKTIHEQQQAAGWGASIVT
ncbi:MAG TPA: DUF1016 N-terminal domain-containing protein [Chlamydiales bacterium]|nr:DUF1016 N-terminal domain-containing protein [Chlamydiales bacterium]